MNCLSTEDKSAYQKTNLTINRLGDNSCIGAIVRHLMSMESSYADLISSIEKPEHRIESIIFSTIVGKNKEEQDEVLKKESEYCAKNNIKLIRQYRIV